MRIAVMDGETTGTEPWRHELWEFGAVVIPEAEDGQLDTAGDLSEVELYVSPDLSLASPDALRVNRYHERISSGIRPEDHGNAAARLAKTLSGAVIASCNVSFDAAFLTKLMLRGGQVPTWHYSPIDIKSICYGANPATMGMSTNALLEAFEVDVPKCLAYYDLSGDSRHSALTDAYLAAALLYEAMGWGTLYGSKCNAHYGSYRCDRPYGHDDNGGHSAPGVVLGQTPFTWGYDQ